MKRLDRSLADSILELLSRLRISEQWFLIILASVVGVGGAFGAIQTLIEEETLASALQKFGLQDVEALPVVDKGNRRKLVGVLKRSDYSHLL